MKPFKKNLLAATIGLMLAPGASHALTGYVYSISVNGKVAGTTGPTFSKTGTMVLFNPITTVGTKNGINNLDVLLTTGSVLTYPPSPGALNFVSNSALASLLGFSPTGAFVTSKLDLVYTSWANNCLTVQPDSSIAAALSTTSPNRFIASSSITAQIYYAQSGPIKLCSTDNLQTFTGTIGLKGTSFYSSITPSVTYQAGISARFAGTYNF